MPDASPSTVARIARWWRRGYDAELLAVAPAVDESGQPLAWDFVHPVNRSPLWRLLRPWYLLPLILLSAMLTFIVWQGTPLLLLLLPCLAIIASAIRGRQRPRIERLALKAYRRYRWRGRRELDTSIAAALERERTPKRLIDAPARTLDR